jgi:hypothetical protein
MIHTHGERALFLALFVGTIGCADSASRTVGPVTSRSTVSGPTAPATSDERVALTTIARLVAEAMDNEPSRQRLKRDMRAAPFREHKLALAPYLQSKDGRALLERMAALGGGEQAVFATLSKIRPLEFYVPVAQQRESWTGKSDVLVLSQLNESEPIVSFDERGQEVSLDRKVAPAQPVLSIVPSETDFTRPMPASSSRNARDKNGDAIGTLEPLQVKGSNLIACGDTCGGGGGGGSTTPPIAPGLYLEFSRILDAKEPWFRGDPEIEVHIHGPNDAANPTYGANLSCSGEHAPDYRKVFNQDGAFWEGRVMLYSADEIVAFNNRFPQGFHVIFWEDDNMPCILKLDSNALVEFLKSASKAAGTVALKVIPTASWPVVAAVFFGTLFENAGSWLLTDDDFLGVAVDQYAAGNPYPLNTHLIMDGATLNGRANIVTHH